MKAQNATVSLILAAGLSTRFGYSKALIEIDGKTMIERLTKFYSMCSDQVFVVTGFQAEHVEKHVDSQDAETIYHPDFALGVLTSLGIGLQHILASVPTFEAVIISPVDFPLTDLGVVEKLVLDAQNSSALIAIPVFENEMGYPIWASREAVELILTETSALSDRDKETKRFLATIPEFGIAQFTPPSHLNERIKRTKVENPDVLANFNTPDMFADWLAGRQSKSADYK